MNDSDEAYDRHVLSFHFSLFEFSLHACCSECNLTRSAARELESLVHLILKMKHGKKKYKIRFFQPSNHLGPLLPFTLSRLSGCPLPFSLPLLPRLLNPIMLMREQILHGALHAPSGPSQGLDVAVEFIKAHIVQLP